MKRGDRKVKMVDVMKKKKTGRCRLPKSPLTIFCTERNVSRGELLRGHT